MDGAWIIEVDNGVLILVTMESGFANGTKAFVALEWGTCCQGSKWTANGSHFMSRLVVVGWGINVVSEGSMDATVDRNGLLTDDDDDGDEAYSTEKFRAEVFDVVEFINTMLLVFSLLVVLLKWNSSSDHFPLCKFCYL